MVQTEDLVAEDSSNNRLGKRIKDLIHQALGTDGVVVARGGRHVSITLHSDAPTFDSLDVYFDPNATAESRVGYVFSYSPGTERSATRLAETLERDQIMGKFTVVKYYTTELREAFGRRPEELTA